MCGIYGYTQFQNKFPDSVLSAMESQQIHRGPDGAGVYTDETYAIGMRRLSILDLANGNQPFSNEDGSIIAICNGELYNFKELKKELSEKHGYTFKTTNDVEMLPALYEVYGSDCFSKINGMFAIAIIDKKRGKLVLGRDRMGIKPLYYAMSGGDIFFASELKSILNTGKVSREIDHVGMSSYLDLNWIPRPTTIFKNIKMVRSGHYLTYSEAGAEETSYWNPSTEPLDWSKEEFVQEYRKRLDRSIDYRLLSDVPVGAFLSGGADSSAICALAGSRREPFNAYHIRWNDIQGKMDEYEFAKDLANRYNLNLQVREVTSIDVIGMLPKLIYHMEEPIGDGALIPTYLLSEISKKEDTVILSGAGGDELFAGYRHHRNYSPVKSLVSKAVNGIGLYYSYYDKYRRRYFKEFKSTFPHYQSKPQQKEVDALFKAQKHSDFPNAMMRSDVQWYLQDDILFLTDKMSMAASIECRVPLLDHTLVELSLQTPSEFKLSPEMKKPLLYEATKDVISEDYFTRKKEGFGFPIWYFIDTFREEYFDKLLRNSRLQMAGYIDAARLSTLLQKRKMSMHEYNLYWQTLIFEIWWRLFIEGDSPEEIW